MRLLRRLFPKKFLSTPSVRRATPSFSQKELVDGISIHALREEGDMHVQTSEILIQDFYPRPP